MPARTLTPTVVPERGIRFALKSLNVAIAVLVGVIHDPGPFHLTISGSPSSLADRQGFVIPLQYRALCRTGSQLVRSPVECNILRHQRKKNQRKNDPRMIDPLASQSLPRLGCLGL
jgi:hypothetical protein